jgi:hypothetical protein
MREQGVLPEIQIAVVVDLSRHHLRSQRQEPVAATQGIEQPRHHPAHTILTGRRLHGGQVQAPYLSVQQKLQLTERRRTRALLAGIALRPTETAAAHERQVSFGRREQLLGRVLRLYLGREPLGSILDGATMRERAVALVVPHAEETLVDRRLKQRRTMQIEVREDQRHGPSTVARPVPADRSCHSRRLRSFCGPFRRCCGPSASQSPPSIHEMPRILPREPQRFRGFSPVFAGARGSLTNRGARIRTGDLADPNGARYQAAPRPDACAVSHNGRGMPPTPWAPHPMTVPHTRPAPRPAAPVPLPSR